MPLLQARKRVRFPPIRTLANCPLSTQSRHNLHRLSAVVHPLSTDNVKRPAWRGCKAGRG
jgi:hypothetical protein